MKKITQLAVIAALVTPTISMATTPQELTVSMVDTIIYKKPEAPASCKAVKATEEQQMALRDAFLEFNDQRKAMRTDLRKSLSDMKKTFSSATSTKEDGAAAQADVGSKAIAMGKLMGDFQMKVFFDILNPEQRDPAMKCLDDLRP
ncbi:hypothetical protein [Bdellovibrio sp. HCB288]|uniref:hypothetical protein n=1 Tax=Bdellovibrio sp. HCB288 TaxID=3394355 RepID=UPI0039B407D9